MAINTTGDVTVTRFDKIIYKLSPNSI